MSTYNANNKLLFINVDKRVFKKLCSSTTNTTTGSVKELSLNFVNAY